MREHVLSKDCWCQPKVVSYMAKPKGEPYKPGKATKEIKDKAKEVQKAIREQIQKGQKGK